MEVWDDANDRRSEQPRRSRIRRFLDRPDALFLIPVVCGFLLMLFSSLGFTISSSAVSIAEIKTADAARDSAIKRANSRIDTLAISQRPVMYMVCILFAESHPQQVPSECGNAVHESRGQ
jgi:hypothetical protein